MTRCDWSGCKARAEQTVVLPQRTVAVCDEHTKRLVIAHRHGMQVSVDPLYVPHPLSRQAPRGG